MDELAVEVRGASGAFYKVGFRSRLICLLCVPNSTDYANNVCKIWSSPPWMQSSNARWCSRPSRPLRRVFAAGVKDSSKLFDIMCIINAYRVCWHRNLLTLAGSVLYGSVYGTLSSPLMGDWCNVFHFTF